ncbi:hypothetical protein VKA52_12795 [Halobacillus sp. HZG1]|uniref:hypothetical protein n=1 Tax=Halobacillus sp. HZG1 TaxID=3111769 RepID=UPI002DB63296|nr:hypothetical protein [Halobacillus sp. HZG1]MEC3884604.1 hypothetical protein [Halobacillus sp. HZG1]
MERKIAIPHFYVWMAQVNEDPKELFRSYVASYVRNTSPGWSLVRIEKMYVVISRKKHERR